MTALEAHPAAAVWPMLPEPDLRRLAQDIAENGQTHPIVLDRKGRVLDGRNRLAACKIAGVEPTFETYDGDNPMRYVLSANNERRHLSLPERAAATALTLASDGLRVNERWQRDSVPDSPDTSRSRGWESAMSEAGLVYDQLGEEALLDVVHGRKALDAAVREASAVREERKRRAELPDDLGVLVDSGELTINDALRRAALSPRYAALVAEGRLTISEAEELNQRDDREHRDAIGRYVNGITSFLHGWNTAINLATDPNRDDVLEELDDQDRERFLEIEQSLKEIR